MYEFILARELWLTGKVGSHLDRFTKYMDGGFSDVRLVKIGHLLMEWGFVVVYEINLRGIGGNWEHYPIPFFEVTLNSEQMNNGKVYLFGYEELIAFQSCIYDGRV